MTKLIAKLEHIDVHGLPHYLIYSGSTVVGRIFDRLPMGMAAGKTTWFWGLSHPHEMSRSRPYFGDAPNREAALAAFRRCWDSARSENDVEAP
jgi:hypothetical protein